MMNTNNLTAVAGAAFTGWIVYWRLNGSIEADTFLDLWAEHDLDDKLLPNRATPDRALRMALKPHSSATLLVRPLKGARGFALVHEKGAAEDEAGDRLRYRVDLAVELDDKDNLVFDPPNDPRADAIEKAYRIAGLDYDTQVISWWLGHKMLPMLDAVPLRDRGGVWFIPRTSEELWNKVVSILRSVSAHDIYQIKALQDEEAVASVLDAISTEATKEIEGVFDDLEGELGKRALKTRGKKMEEVLSKLTRYEGLLGTKLDELRERAEEANAASATALLSLMDDGDED